MRCNGSSTRSLNISFLSILHLSISFFLSFYLFFNHACCKFFALKGNTPSHFFQNHYSKQTKHPRTLLRETSCKGRGGGKARASISNQERDWWRVLLNHAHTSIQLYPPPPSLFQPPPSSIQLHPAHFGLHPALCNTLSNIWTKILHVIGENLDRNLGRKIKSCPFWLKIGTHGILEVLIPNPDLDFWNFDPKIHFQIWAQKLKVVHFD